MWRDIDQVVKTDCPLCAGVGFYEVVFEYLKSKDQHRRKLVKAIRVVGTGIGPIEGYRMMTRCHMCGAGYDRNIPREIVSWDDGQIDELLSREQSNGDAPF